MVELPRDPETGKRRQKWVAVKGTKRDAERVLAEMISQIEKGALGAASSALTVGEYLDRWLQAIRSSVRDGSWKNYSAHVKRLKECVGSMKLMRLTPLDVQAAIQRLVDEGRWAARTVQSTAETLRTALRQAVAWGLIARDPTRGAKLPGASRREMTVWTEWEAAKFLASARGSRYYALFRTALATGMRLGELLGLVWQDVDLEEGVIHVRRALAYPEKGIEPAWTEPKTPNSRRKIPLDKSTTETLRAHRKRQIEERLRRGAEWRDYGLVFCTRRGTPLRRADVHHRLQELARAAGVPAICAHDLRHTHATLLLKRGVHPKVVAERLGHASVAVTLDVYSHVLPDTQETAAQAMEGCLGEIRGG
ncbi:MAG: site-specific integrase [Bacillota bacterium]